MRRCSKPWPPANVSPDGQAARRFVDAEREYLATLPGRVDKSAFARAAYEQRAQTATGVLETPPES